MVVGGKGSTEVANQKGCSVLQIKQDDKFFCRLLSKESSMSHPSFRVAAVAVPFMWESQPGTPKYSFFSDESLPPLTPPPSYFTSKTMNKNKNNNNNKKKKLLGSRSNNNLLLSLFLKLRHKKSNNTTNSSSPSSSFSSNWPSPWSSSLDSSSKVVVAPPPIGKVGRRRFLSIGSSFDFRGGDANEEEEEGVSSPNSTLCFGVHRSASSKGNNNGGSCRR